MTATVRWAELLPREFLARQSEAPVLYLPMGLCEPHGQVAAFGLDTIKADYICDEAAARFGGIVAPTAGYHIHETGSAVDWLMDVMEGVNPRMGSLPPAVVLQTFLYQLRAFANAGFRLVVVVSGHAHGHPDLRLVAEEFMRDAPVKVVVRADPELVEGLYTADHAGRYELSQLLHLRPDLVDMARIEKANAALGRFALNPDAHEATADLGAAIMEACVLAVGELVARHAPRASPDAPDQITLKQTDAIWQRIRAREDAWVTL